jgi:AraC-like DNA-binding protein
MRMFEDLLPAFEKSIMDAAGSIPVVFKGIERTLERSFTVTSHSRHEYHELTYLRNGKAEFIIDGRRVLLEKGGAVVIRPRTTHTVHTLDGSSDMIVLYFGFTRHISAEGSQASEKTPTAVPGMADSVLQNVQTLRSTDIEPRTLEQFINFATGKEAPENDKTAEPYILIKGKSRQDIAGLVERILRESRREAYGRELMMQLLSMELLVALARGLREEWEESLRVRTGKARELVRIARDFIVENHDRDLSVADAAGYVFLSQGYFTRAFRDETGMSPMTFLMQVRVDHACKLLEQRDIKVSGVATQVGFSSPQRFNAAFRKHIGMTPMEYRHKVLDQHQADNRNKKTDRLGKD